MRGYGQFCPVAKAAEIFAERWTPLIVRELLMGHSRFNELERGLPRISRSVLLQRLRSLEDAGIVEREVALNGSRPEYHLTKAGSELFHVVKSLGDWGQRWFNPDINFDDLEPDLLMWDIHRRINIDRLPDHRVVAEFVLSGDNNETYWLVLERPEPSVCYQHPGLDVDVTVHADTLALHRVWMGRMAFSQAIKDRQIRLEGPRELTRQLPDWLALSMFAGIPAASW